MVACIRAGATDNGVPCEEFLHWLKGGSAARRGTPRWGPALRALRALRAPHRTPRPYEAGRHAGLGPRVVALLRVSGMHQRAGQTALTRNRLRLNRIRHTLPCMNLPMSGSVLTMSGILRLLRDEGMTYSDFERGCHRVRTASWFSDLLAGPRLAQTWAVAPPGEDTYAGFQALFGIDEQTLRNWIALEWYGVDGLGGLSEELHAMALRIERLDEDDVQVIEAFLDSLEGVNQSLT